MLARSASKKPPLTGRRTISSALNSIANKNAPQDGNYTRKQFAKVQIANYGNRIIRKNDQFPSATTRDIVIIQIQSFARGEFKDTVGVRLSRSLRKRRTFDTFGRATSSAVKSNTETQDEGVTPLHGPRAPERTPAVDWRAGQVSSSSIDRTLSVSSVYTPLGTPSEVSWRESLPALPPLRNHLVSRRSYPRPFFRERCLPAATLANAYPVSRRVAEDIVLKQESVPRES